MAQKKTPARTTPSPKPRSQKTTGARQTTSKKMETQASLYNDLTNVGHLTEGGEVLTTNQGLAISDNQNSLKGGPRGPTLLEDFILREKITHFDHERIPERIVHARGSAAHGYFELAQDMSDVTRAKFLNGKKGKRTPIFTRFSTVQGGSSSADTVRDVRGFAIKFYTEEGNYDFVGNNIPVFFIQDAIKFPDLVHAVKMEPHNGMPQGASAHDNFWDFVTLTPESTHMLMWAMSDRAIPRSLRMMQGFGVHTFALVNEEGDRHFVKFHLKPKLGTHSLLWDEAQKIIGKDADFHRRDLYESIDEGFFPEWDVFFQLFTEDQETSLGIDLLDPTKLVPEEIVPLTHVGKIVLDRNPDNFFAETEQVAFHPGHLVPGIEFTNDPLLQGRLFSYTDTQLIRLGGPNFHEIPVNRPQCPVHNNQRDGYMRQTVNKGRVNYEPNSFAQGCPMHSAEGFKTYAEKLSGAKVRQRPDTFADHYSQAQMFYQSLNEVEQRHVQKSFSFELSKVETVAIRKRMVWHLLKVNKDLAQKVADHLALEIKEIEKMQMPPTTAPVSTKKYKPMVEKAESLSQFSMPGETLESRMVALLLFEDSQPAAVKKLKQELQAEGLRVKLVATSPSVLKTFEADLPLTSTSPVEYDGLMVLGHEVEKPYCKYALREFMKETYRHLKTIYAEDFEDFMMMAGLTEYDLGQDPQAGFVSENKKATQLFLTEMQNGRHWSRLMM